MSKDTQCTITVPDSVPLVNFLGYSDSVLRVLEKGFAPAKLHILGREITVMGAPSEVALAENFISELISVASSGEHLTPSAVERAINLAREGLVSPTKFLQADILSNRGRIIRAKTIGQKEYVDAIDKHTVVFGIGPAGTGKTYLAMAKAVAALQNQQVSRIILTRPAVEAGESLGFLPGTLNEKIDPYVRPLYDALYDMLDPDAIMKLMAAGTIEVAPLAYMRGRTLNDAFIILDEAQNTTPEQMKMFLTRLGFNSKMIITGDITQIDLPKRGLSGLPLVQKILANVAGIKFTELTSADVVRNSLVADIIDAYSEWDEK